MLVGGLMYQVEPTNPAQQVPARDFALVLLGSLSVTGRERASGFSSMYQVVRGWTSVRTRCCLKQEFKF